MVRQMWSPETHPHYDAHSLPLRGEREQLQNIIVILFTPWPLSRHRNKVSIYQSQTHTFGPLDQRYLWGLWGEMHKVSLHTYYSGSSDNLICCLKCCTLPYSGNDCGRKLMLCFSGFLRVYYTMQCSYM